MDYPIGISYGDFDDKITSSSEYNSEHSVKGCKLNQIMPSGQSSAWCAGEKDKERPWIQVDLGQTLNIKAVSIQGRNDANQYVTKFRILWSRDNNESHLLHFYEFEGNNNNYSVVKRIFPQVIPARLIRLQVLSYHEYPSLRWELHYVI